MNKTIRDHIVWVDWLRIIACFMVVISHSCDFFVSQLDNNRFEFLSGAAWGSLVRPCVPLFIMISGVLLLPIKTDMTTFYSRRMKRIVLPLIFWSIILPLLFFLYLSLVQTTSPTIVMEDHTLNATLKKIATFVFNFNFDTIPFWYLYMLIGLYLFIPIIGAWLNQALQKDMKIFLRIWLVSLCLPYIELLAPLLGYTGNYGNMGILGVCTWNPYGMLYYFSGFIGYLVLAHYLQKYPLNWSWKRTLQIAIPSFIIGYAITLGGFLFIQNNYPDNFAALEIFWYFCGINVFMMTSAIYLIVQKVKFKPSAIVSKIAALTFGIYLCHFIVVQSGYDLIHTYLYISPYLQIPAIAIFSFLVSLLIIGMMNKSKLLRKMIG